jgi:hypothetical protein
VSAPAHLNESQRRHLLSSCQYADKLLAEIEDTLAASQSKSPFPKYRPDLSPAQSKVIQDYIAVMRAQDGIERLPFGPAVGRGEAQTAHPIASKADSRLLRAWVTKTFAELLERFDSYAGAYRAQLGREGASAA